MEQMISAISKSLSKDIRNLCPGALKIPPRPSDHNEVRQREQSLVILPCMYFPEGICTEDEVRLKIPLFCKDVKRVYSVREPLKGDLHV